VKVYLVGRLAAESDGVAIDERRLSGRQGRLFFAYLVMGQGRPIPRDELADVLWEGNPPATWEKALGVLASKLRSVLGEIGSGGATLTAASGCYRLDLAKGSWIDVIAAKAAVDEAEAALAQEDVESAKRSATGAESLTRGPFLPGDDGTWVEEKRRELAGTRTRAVSALSVACLRASETEEAVRWAEKAVEAEPFRESGYRLLMEAHIAAGNRAEALRVYERCRRLLAEELGAFPSPETESLYRDLLEAPVAPPADTSSAPLSQELGRGSGGGSRRKIAAGVVLLLAAVAASAIFAIERQGSSTPVVVPNSVVRIDPSTLRVHQVIRVENQPDLVIAAGRYIWVTSHILRDVGTNAQNYAGYRTLTRVDPSTGEAHDVSGVQPCGLTADPSGDIWVANCYPRSIGTRNNVIRIDARTLNFAKTWTVPRGGDGYYRGLVYGGGSLWVGQTDGTGTPAPTLTEVNPQRGAGGPIRLKLAAGAMAWADGYGDVWMTNFDNGTVTRFDATTGKLSRPLDSGLVNPGSAVVEGNTLWLGDWATGELSRLHAVGPPRLHRISLPTSAGVWNLAAGAGFIWATTPRAHALWRIDPSTDKVTRIHIPYLPAGVAVDANNVWVTVRGP
jgi:SARP family transcriptional regulator, regulator of embCAB operon